MSQLLKSAAEDWKYAIGSARSFNKITWGERELF